nr:serine/threonine-protein kinase Nek2 isoform X1 [Crassostrea gigas]
MHYIAPEMTDGKGNYNSKIDIWAIGCDCYEMGTSKYAFDGRNVTELKNAVGKNMLPNINSLRFCETMREMIIQMLALDPTKRPDAATLHEEVLRHDCQNMKQCQKSHKQTQVFSHSTVIPGQQRNEVFLSSQSSNISTIQRCPDHDREPTQNTDSFEKQNGEDSSCLSPRPYSKGLKLTVSGEQNTDSYEFNKPRSVSTSSLGDSIKSTSSSRIDSSSDIPNLPNVCG